MGRSSESYRPTLRAGTLGQRVMEALASCPEGAATGQLAEALGLGTGTRALMNVGSELRSAQRQGWAERTAPAGRSLRYVPLATYVLTTAGRLALEGAAARDDSRIVELRDGAGMTWEEIGTATGMTGTGARYRYRRAVRAAEREAVALTEAAEALELRRRWLERAGLLHGMALECTDGHRRAELVAMMKRLEELETALRPVIRLAAHGAAGQPVR
jgi:hypothetical protein